jgi:hypothetical protein
MFYFKKIFITDCTTKQLENALRKAASKKSRPLDFDISSMDIGTDKYFFGYENKNGLTFTRIRTSFERLIPKIIIKLSPDPSECYYEIRFGVFTAIWVLFYGFFLLMLLVNLIRGEINIEALPPIFIILLIISSAYYLEFRLTTSRVKKAIRKYVEVENTMAQ